MNKLIKYLILFLIIPFSSIAQDDEAYKKMKEDYEREIKKMDQNFNSFKDSINNEFADFLKKDWEEFNVFSAVIKIKEPKPNIVPKLEKEDNSKEKPVKLNIKEIIIPQHIPSTRLQPIEIKHESDIKELEKKPTSPNYNKGLAYAIFKQYNMQIAIEYSNKINEQSLVNNSESEVSNFWKNITNSEYEHTYNSCIETKNSLMLNDWSFFILCKNTSDKLYNLEQNNEKVAFTVFLMNQSGYKIKIGRREKQLIYLVPISIPVYGISYILIDNERYYIFEHNKERSSNEHNISTYKSNFPSAKNHIDMNIYSPPLLGDSTISKTLNYTINEIPVSINYNPNYIEFYKDYPQCDISVYAEALPSNELKKSLLNELKPLIANKNQQDAVNALLNFMHYAFDYKTDDEQFKFEKWFFLEENFYYPYNDCEDRSILFSYLVEELLGLKTALLHYPGHYTTAVLFTERIKGDYVIINNEKYIICDPTYIGSTAGISMPEYKNSSAKVYLKNNKGF